VPIENKFISVFKSTTKLRLVVGNDLEKNEDIGMVMKTELLFRMETRRTLKD
jgi:hypothetical protein